MNDAPTRIRNANPYLALGVRPFINCASVRTAHSGSLMLPEVRAAIDQASRQFVSLDELMDGAGRRIAELTGAPWGIVTCGSAAALTLATAACVAGNDPVKMVRLPFTEGWPNRVVMPKHHRFAYDQAIRMVGTHIVEIETIDGLDAALQQPIAMIALLGKDEAGSAVRLEDMVARARPLGVPVLVDAASEHIRRPDPYLSRGADMVIYSGGKFLRGPQTSGLLLGRKDLIEAAWRNASPHQAFARGMKVSKEDVIGVLAALEVWFERRDPSAELERWNRDLSVVARRLAMPGVRAEVVPPAGVVRVPCLRIGWDDTIGLTGEAVRLRLLDGQPRIMIDDMSATDRSVQVDPFGLQPGEAEQVGRALAEALSAAGTAADRAVADRPAVDAPVTDGAVADGPTEDGAAAHGSVSGAWDVEVSFLRSERKHRLDLRQDGSRLTGQHASPQFDGPVTGSVNRGRVRLLLSMWHEGTLIAYHFDGLVSDGAMQGDVTLGSATHHHQGPINLAQFGPGRFQAIRSADRP